MFVGIIRIIGIQRIVEPTESVKKT